MIEFVHDNKDIIMYGTLFLFVALLFLCDSKYANGLATGLLLAFIMIGSSVA